MIEMILAIIGAFTVLILAAFFIPAWLEDFNDKLKAHRQSTISHYKKQVKRLEEENRKLKSATP